MSSMDTIKVTSCHRCPLSEADDELYRLTCNHPHLPLSVVPKCGDKPPDDCPLREHALLIELKV